MAKLPIYSTLEEKAEIFEQIVLTTKEDVRTKFIEKMKEEINQEKANRFIYRGITNSQYKIYNSSQRNYAEKELQNITSYNNLISGTIEEALNFQNGLLRKYFSGFMVPYDIPVLSFLQHYGAPTPLIDWTYNFEIALFFTTDGQKHNASDNQIDNYFSVYVIDKQACGGDLINISTWLEFTLSQINQITVAHPEADATQVINQYNQFSYDTFKQIGIFYVSDFERNIRIPALTTQSNLNVINQQGLFIFNASENEPLEHFFGSNRDPFSGLPKIKCYDIHKSLYYYVLNEITVARRAAGLIELDRDFIYPQEENIAKNAFTNYLSRP